MPQTQQPELLVIGHYKLEKTLGQGTYGKVKLATDTRTNEKVAVKILEKAQIKSEKQVARIQREIRFLKLLHHPHIVKVYDVIETSDFIYIAMEYAVGGELFDYIVAHKRVKEREARIFFRQILSAVDYCHQNSVIHRDLKPENLLLDSNKNIKIIDFGFGNTFTPEGLLETFCGSPFYAAPEMILGKRYEGPEVDMWSLGVILYALICGHLPFDDDNMKELYKKIAAGSYSIPNYVPSDCCELIRMMITVDPKKRATLEQVKKHPWVNEGFELSLNNYLPERSPIPPEQVDSNIIQRLQAFGYTAEDVIERMNKHYEHITSAKSNSLYRIHPIVATYYLLQEMLDREIQKQKLASSARRSSAASAATTNEQQKPPKSISSQDQELQKPVSPNVRTLQNSETTSVSTSLYAINEDESSDETESKRQIPVFSPKTKLQNAIMSSMPGNLNTLSATPTPPQPNHFRGGSLDRNKSTSVAIPGMPQTFELPNRLQIRASTDAGRPSHIQNVNLDNTNPGQQASSSSSSNDHTRRASLPSSIIQFLKGKPKGPTQSPSTKFEIRQVNGWFMTVSTTSSKQPTEIIDEVFRVLDSVSGVTTTYDANNTPWFVNVEVNVGLFPSSTSHEEEVEIDGASSDDITKDSATARPESTASQVSNGAKPVKKDETVSFEIEVCHVPKLNMYGLNFRRLHGGVWRYKEVYARLISMMNL